MKHPCRTASLEHCSPCQRFAPYSSRTQLDTYTPTTPIHASFNLESGHPLVLRPRAIYAHLLVAQASAPGKPLSCIAQRRGCRPQRARSQRHERARPATIECSTGGANEHGPLPLRHKRLMSYTGTDSGRRLGPGVFAVVVGSGC